MAPQVENCPKPLCLSQCLMFKIGTSNRNCQTILKFQNGMSNDSLRFQNGMLNDEEKNLKSQNGMSSWGGLRRPSITLHQHTRRWWGVFNFSIFNLINVRPRTRLQADRKILHPKRNFFPKKFGSSRNIPYLCQRDKDSGRPLGRAHVRRSASMPGIFYAQRATDKTAAIPKE